MTKPLLQDMIPSKKSIRDIPVADRNHNQDALQHKHKTSHSTSHKISKRTEKNEDNRDTTSEFAHHISDAVNESLDQGDHDGLDLASVEDGYFSNLGRDGRNIGFWIAGIVVFIIAAIGIASYFEHATLKVTIKSKDVPVGSVIVASADSTHDAPKLVYQAIQAEKTGETIVIGTTEEKVSTRATGTIIIYNNYSAAPQKLIANTRFEAPNGNIYRITSSVTVPGKKTVAGKPVAGSVQATVVADAAGAQYNSDLTDFTIPGFKGDPRYNGFYGRSKTPLTGGYEGIIKKVSDADVAAAKTKLEQELRDGLIKQAIAQTPDSLILFKNAYAITYETIASTPNDKGLTIQEKARINVFLLNRDDLSKTIADLTLTGTDKNIPYSVSNLDDITFAFSGKDLFDAEAKKDVAFILQGNAHLVARVDAKALATDAQGIKKSDISSLLIKYPGADAADVTVRPFWKSVLPSKAKDIEVILQEAK